MKAKKETDEIIRDGRSGHRDRNRTGFHRTILTACLAVFIFCAGCLAGGPSEPSGADMITVVDDAGRSVTVPADSYRIACVGGCGPARYLVYLNEEDRIIALDEVETRESRRTFDARPYALAHRTFLALPSVGDKSGSVHLESLALVNPDLLILHFASPDTIQTADHITAVPGIPVVLVSNQGDFGDNRAQLERTMFLLAGITNSEERCRDFFAYFDRAIGDLNERTQGIDQKPTAYVAGVAYNGAHPTDSTDPGYPPFICTNTDNVASGLMRDPGALNVTVSKEQILEWDPAYIFVDASTQRAPGNGAVGDLLNDPSYRGMTAVKNGHVYGLVPYVWVGINHESTLVNAYYIGTVLYPDRFRDIDPVKKADEIYEFTSGKAVFTEMNDYLNGAALAQIPAGASS